MIKRNTLLAVFGLLILLSIISFFPIAYGYDYIFDDAEDDVYQYCQSTDETVIGDYHNEIDIVNLNITGKYVSFTVAGDLSDWNNSYWGAIIFSSRFVPYGHLDVAFSVPFYRIDFYKDPSFFVYIRRGDQVSTEVWNGTAWEDELTATYANIFSEASQHSITAYIPDDVEEIPSNLKCLLYTEISSFFSDCDYADFAPALPTVGGGDKIPSYNLSILIYVMIGISLLLLRKRNKLK